MEVATRPDGGGLARSAAPGRKEAASVIRISPDFLSGFLVRRTTRRGSSAGHYSEADYRICARLGQPRSGDFWASDRRCAWTRSPDETTPADPELSPAGKDASPSPAWDDTLMARLAEGSPPSCTLCLPQSPTAEKTPSGSADHRED